VAGQFTYKYFVLNRGDSIGIAPFAFGEMVLT